MLSYPSFAIFHTSGGLKAAKKTAPSDVYAYVFPGYNFTNILLPSPEPLTGSFFLIGQTMLIHFKRTLTGPRTAEEICPEFTHFSRIHNVDFSQKTWPGMRQSLRKVNRVTLKNLPITWHLFSGAYPVCPR